MSPGGGDRGTHLLEVLVARPSQVGQVFVEALARSRSGELPLEVVGDELDDLRAGELTDSGCIPGTPRAHAATFDLARCSRTR